MKIYKLMFLVRNEKALDDFGHIIVRTARWLYDSEITTIEVAPIMNMRVVRIYFRADVENTKQLRRIYRTDVAREAHVMNVDVLEPEYDQGFELLDWKAYAPNWFEG